MAIVSFPVRSLFLCEYLFLSKSHTGWGGHWRGENGTLETVICPLSYTTRRPLEAMCGQGYTISNGALNTYFAADLLHRLYHVTSIGDGVVEHYADSYAECLELAEHEPEDAVRNTHSLQYFALEIWAMEVTLPGEGCIGRAATPSAAVAASSSMVSPAVIASTTPSSMMAATSAAAATSSSAATSAQAVGQSATSTSSAATVSSSSLVVSSMLISIQECHTHANGEVHCV
jgi:hypothetical protein